MLDYIKVPKSLIESKELGDKRLICFLASVFSKRQSSSVNYMTDVANAAGYFVNRNLEGAYKKLQPTIVALDGVYLTYNKDAQIDGKPLARFIETSECFGTIYRREFECIIEARESWKQNGRRINHAHVFLLLSYLRLRTCHVDGLPECTSDLLCRISDVIGISVRCISSSLKILEELQIIHSEELPRYLDTDGNWHSNVRIFVDYEKPGYENYNWRHEVSRGINRILSCQID